MTYLTGGAGARLEPATVCGAPVAYAIGWSYTTGGSCGGGGADRPTDQVFHFLKVTVDGAEVTVTPDRLHGNVFDEQTYTFLLDRPRRSTPRTPPRPKA